MTIGSSGDMTRTREGLLDALEALADHRLSVVVVGAQAIYLHTGGTSLAIAEMTRDSDLAVDPRSLGADPLIEQAMRAGGFEPGPGPKPQPGAWTQVSTGVPVDLMVPKSLAQPGGRRGARVPHHGSKAMRQARGLEAPAVDHVEMTVTSLPGGSGRSMEALVATPGALLVAKMIKIGERVDAQGERPQRVKSKDAHDVYRLLEAVSTEELADSLGRLCASDVAREVTLEALTYLDALFALGPEAVGSQMAGATEEGVGNPEQVAESVAYLAQDLMEELGHRGIYPVD